MTNEEKILTILEAMQGDIKDMKTDIAELKEDVAELKEDVAELKEVQAEHTTALNALIEWAEECRELDRFPLPKLM